MSGEDNEHAAADPSTLVWRLVASLGSANFVAFALVGYALGGDAFQGRVDSGVFYLGNHGEYTQVSELTYRLSRLHGLSAIVGLLAAAYGVLYLERRNDPVYRRWAKPYRSILLGTLVLTIVAWSFKFPPRTVIPVSLLVTGSALVICFRQLRGSRPPESG